MKTLTGFVVAVAFALTATTSASAQSVSDLQAQINALLAQLSALQGGTTTTNNFTMDLTIGSEGADVVALQTALESKGTLVMPAGVSKGYFGALTQAALAAYQAQVGISPASGYFGPITRAHFNSMTTSTGSTTGTTTSTSGLEGGEASLESFNLSSEDDAEEGAMKHVATIEFDVEDGDVEINRVDVTFEGVGSPTENDPWDAFETITLMIDGDEIAEEDIDDEDDWLDDNSPFVFRLTDIDYVAEEGEEVEIEVYLTANSSVDDAGTNASWKIYIDEEGIRAVDSEGIQNYTGSSSSDSVTFDIDAKGGDEELKIKSSSSDPEASTLLVDDTTDSDWHEVFVFDLEAEENDIELDTVVINVETGTATYNLVVNEIVIEIDGEEFDNPDVLYYTDNTFGTLTVSSGTTVSKFAQLTFDIDGDVTIDGDDEVEVVVLAEFNKTTGNYVDGTETIKVSAASADGEGADDVSDIDGGATGETHTLSTIVATVSGVTSSSDENETETVGTFSFDFNVAADDEDVTVEIANIVATVIGGDNLQTVATTTLVSPDAEVVTAGDEYTVLAGSNADFTVTFTVDPTVAGTYYVELESVAGTPVDKLSGPESLVAA